MHEVLIRNPCALEIDIATSESALLQVYACVRIFIMCAYVCVVCNDNYYHLRYKSGLLLE